MKTSLLNLIHIVGFISIFSYSMPMNYLPVSLCTVSQLLLVILGSWKYKLCVNKRILILILYVIAVSLSNSARITSVTLTTFIRFLVCILGSYFFAKSYEGNWRSFIKVYLKICIVFSVVSVIQEFGYLLNIPLLYDMSGLIGVSDINLDTSGPFLRCPSLTMEPAQISFLLFPAIYLKMSDFFDKTNYVPGKKIYTLILIGAFLTFTFTIFLFILLAFCYFIFKRISLNNLSYVVVICLAMIVLLTSENNVSNKFRSLFVASEQLQSADNLSAFALISNVLIAKDAAIDNPFGTGFFTTGQNYDTYIHHYFLITKDSLELNKDGGGVMYVKILSEYSFVGLFLFFIFILKLKNCKNPINISSSCIFLILCVRVDSYTSSLLFVFLSFVCITAFPKRNSNQDKFSIEINL